MPDTRRDPFPGNLSVQAGFCATGLFFLAVLIVFHETTWSMISIWLRSGTFAHGFLILPISIWLIWNMKNQLRLLHSRSVIWVALLIMPLGALWLLGRLVDALVVQQLAVVAILIVGAWAIMGHQLARALVFPLLFLFLAVPMGEDLLVPPMMEFTARSTVWLIQQTGVPVYRDGMFFTLPSGNWSVVQACSGVRYIIASFTLGLIYAYLTYRSFSRQFLFVLASIIVPVFANTGRAYMIVMLGHWSDMTVAVGVDHLLYGWAFFGVVMFLLFWLGSLFREDIIESTDEGDVHAEYTQKEAPPSFVKLIIASTLALLMAAVWPWMATKSDTDKTQPLSNIMLPEAVGEWSRVDDSPWLWRPSNRVARQATAFYERDGKAIGLYVQYPDGSEASGEDVVGSSSRIGSVVGKMRKITWGRISIHVGAETVVVDQALMQGGGGKFLTWSWYRIGETYTSNDYFAKFQEVLGVLGLVPAGSSRILLVMPLLDSPEAARIVMQDFLIDHGNPIRKAFSAVTTEKQQ